MKLRVRRTNSMLAMLLVCTLSSADETVAVPVPDQISEGISLSGSVRAAVTEFWHSNGRFPFDNAEAGIIQPYEITGHYVASVTVTNTDGIISVEFGEKASQEIFGRTIEMTPTILSGKKVRWSCSTQFIAENLLPTICNGKIVPPGT